MYFLNLTLPQFAALFASVSVFVVALYLLDRSRRRQVVSTLRFWTASENAAEVKRRRRIQQPWSLVLQLFGILMLLLALAQFRIGSPGPKPRDHVLILDTSAWMGARGQKELLMDRAKSLAASYLKRLPPGDRVMLVRADALATPATSFEANRRALERAISESRPGSTALNLDQAFEFARQAQRLQGGRAGEIVFAGAGRIAGDQPESLNRALPNLRVLEVADPVENCGLTNIGLRRSTADPETWEILVGVRNYSSSAKQIPLGVQFGGAVVGTRRLTLSPGSEQNASFKLRTRAAGMLEARLLSQDGFATDDSATIEIPAQAPLKVTVYSQEPDLLRPVLAANPLVQATFLNPANYREPSGADIVILDRFRPPTPPGVNAIWIQPPVNGSPLPVRTTVSNVSLTRWHSDQPLANGLRTKDLKLESAEVYRASEGDIPVADVDAGPVILAHPGKPKTVVIGFHPVRSAMRYELATPLLFANLLHWMAPEIFRTWELNAGSVGTVNVSLGADVDPSSVKVVSSNGAEAPFSVDGHTLRFFAGTPGIVRVLTGDRELVYSLALPEVADARWLVPATAKRGLPPQAAATFSYIELWHWLALLGAAALIAEWFVFGKARFGRGASRVPSPGGRSAFKKAVGA